MAKTSLRKCMECRERAVAPTRLPTYTAELEHDGRKYSVSLNDFEVLQCERCGAIVLLDASSERLYEALRVQAGLLAPAEIRQKREALKLTQKQLAEALRISESTLSRWETGAQIQQRAMDAFLRVFFESPDARRILGVPRIDQKNIIGIDPQVMVKNLEFETRRTIKQGHQNTGLPITRDSLSHIGAFGKTMDRAEMHYDMERLAS